MLDIALHGLDVCLWLTGTISRIDNLGEMYDAALEALARGLDVRRSSILLFDEDGVMRFKAWRGLSPEYRAVVEGHTPWRPESSHARPIVVMDVQADAGLAGYGAHFARERIRALAFIPLTSGGRVIGKFMLYYDVPRAPTEDELRLAEVIAAQVAFAVERCRAQQRAEQSEARLRFALQAAHMGTWEWNPSTDVVRWSDTLERIHGLPPGGFDGTFASFEREVHPDDRDRVLTAARRAIDEGLPYEVEYRIVTPGGELRWLEGKGRVEYDEAGQPVRMSGVCMNVTRRKQAEADRLHSAQEANRTKDEFLAVLSHELRTPLNAILGWVQLLESGTLDAGRQAQAIAVIGRNARLQAQLIEQILDVSRIITGKLKLDCARCRPAQLVESAVRAIEPAAADKQIALTADLDADLPEVDGDANRLQQIFGNLLSNALKFTPAGGRIAVRTGRHGGRISVEVSDTGAGIAPEFLPYIFERFRQADGTPTRQHGGLGLGLAITRHLVELHGGTIRAASDGAGRGATLQVWLPVAGGASRSTLAGASPAVASAGSLRGARVLIVDDEPDARQLLGAILARHGAAIQEVSSAQAAIEALERASVDLVVADIGMPDIDGYELMRRIRASDSRVAAIAVTAYARPEDRARALAAGYDEFIAKPFDTETLVRISAALRTDRGARRSTTAVRP
jgi:PAS domain S-box-containing protein